VPESSILPEVFLDRATPVPIVGIGQLMDKGEYRELVYEVCGHTLAIAKFAGLGPVEQVRRWHATCVECEFQRQYAGPPRRYARYSQLRPTNGSDSQ
jgi:hypothetical protein